MPTIDLQAPCPGTLSKVNKAQGQECCRNEVVFSIARPGGGGRAKDVKWKIDLLGTVEELFKAEGDAVVQGAIVARVRFSCDHHMRLGPMCTICGADTTKEGAGETDIGDRDVKKDSESLMVLHDNPALRMNKEMAVEMGTSELQRQISTRRLTLVVDLDHTVVHTVPEPNHPWVRNWCEREGDALDLHLIALYDPPQYSFVKVRPHARAMLEALNEKFELHIFTAGVRVYAMEVARIIDPTGKLFQGRIITADEAIHRSKKDLQMRHLFPAGDQMVCVIDDTPDVWNGFGGLVLVERYFFFRGPTHAERKQWHEKGESRLKALLEESKKGDASNDEVEASTERLRVEKVHNHSELATRIVERLKEDRWLDAVALARDWIAHRTSLPDGHSLVLTVEQLIVPLIVFAIPRPSDTDTHLQDIEKILERTHSEFFAAYDAGETDVRVGTVLAKQRSAVLAHCHLCFSGIIPVQSDATQHPLWRMALAHGAQCHTQFTSSVTHLIAARAGTEKVVHAQSRQEVYIVTKEWLQRSCAVCERMDEALFWLDGVPKYTVLPRNAIEAAVTITEADALRAEFEELDDDDEEEDDEEEEVDDDEKEKEEEEEETRGMKRRRSEEENDEDEGDCVRRRIDEEDYLEGQSPASSDGSFDEGDFLADIEET